MRILVLTTEPGEAERRFGVPVTVVRR